MADIQDQPSCVNSIGLTPAHIPSMTISWQAIPTFGITLATVSLSQAGPSSLICKIVTYTSLVCSSSITFHVAYCSLQWIFQQHQNGGWSSWCPASGMLQRLKQMYTILIWKSGHAAVQGKGNSINVVTGPAVWLCLPGHSPRYLLHNFFSCCTEIQADCASLNALMYIELCIIQVAVELMMWSNSTGCPEGNAVWVN